MFSFYLLKYHRLKYKHTVYNIFIPLCHTLCFMLHTVYNIFIPLCHTSCFMLHTVYNIFIPLCHTLCFMLHTWSYLYRNKPDNSELRSINNYLPKVIDIICLSSSPRGVYLSIYLSSSDRGVGRFF